MKPIVRWFKRALVDSERRKSIRRIVHGLHAHYWGGGAPTAHEIRDVSETGLYVVTEERWYLGTVVSMTLQIANRPETDPDRSISTRAKVVRTGSDGVAFAFATPEGELRRDGSHKEREAAAQNSPEGLLRKFLAHAGHAAAAGGSGGHKYSASRKASTEYCSSMQGGIC